MNDYADAICSALPMETVATYYGYEPNRAGFIQCPFHGGEKTASLKVYGGKRGWHCFGCNMGGSIIDFVRQLHNSDFKAACTRLNDDFRLGIIPDRNTDYGTRKAAENKAREFAEKRKAETVKHDRLKTEYENALDRYVAADLLIIQNPPGSMFWGIGINDIETAKHKLGEAETALYEYETNERNRAVNP